MMRRTVLFIFCLAMSALVRAQKNELAAFIPAGYDTLPSGVARGDLNKDGIGDIVLALYHRSEQAADPKADTDGDSLPPRLLVILLGTGKGYRKAVVSAHAILCKDCGGVFGDPFAGIAIRNNVLEIAHYGGSAWKWSYFHKFRYRNNDWYLIGQTRNSFWSVKRCEKLDDFAGTDYEDINYLTGQYQRKKISQDCRLIENKKGRIKILPLVSITKFIIDN